MNTLFRDHLILLGISATVCCGLLVPGKRNAYVERNWGSVFYSSPIHRSEAAHLADVLVREQVFRGSPTSMRLIQNVDHYEWSIAFRQDYESIIPRDTFVQLVGQIWSRAFPNQPVKIVLSDEQFRPFELLVSPPVAQSVP